MNYDLCVSCSRKCWEWKSSCIACWPNGDKEEVRLAFLDVSGFCRFFRRIYFGCMSMLECSMSDCPCYAEHLIYDCNRAGGFCKKAEAWVARYINTAGWYGSIITAVGIFALMFQLGVLAVQFALTVAFLFNRLLGGA